MKAIIAQRYEITRSLGQGGGGTCYLARDLKAKNSLVALKAVSLPNASEEMIRAFHRECNLLRKIQHPNLARLMDFGREDELLFYCSEYVEGSDFVRSARPLDWNAVFSLIVQGSWGLAALHNQGIWHRDIKPLNLLVGKVHVPGEKDRQNRLLLKIIDFGLATPASSGPAGPAVGSLAYLAPEILARRPSDQRADLYAWGVVIYEMALGKLPFAGSKNFAEMLKNLTQGDIDLKPLKESEEIPRGIIEILKRLLPREPARRLSGADEIIRILNESEGERFPLTHSSLDRLPILLDELPPPAREAGKISLEEDPEQVLNKALTLVRSGKRREAWEWAQAHWERMETAEDPRLQEGFFGVGIHALIEQGEFPTAQIYLKRAETHSAFSPQTSAEWWILHLQLALRQGHFAEAERIQGEIPSEVWRLAKLEQKSRWENFSGFLFQSLGRLAEAAARYEASSSIAEQTGRRDHSLSFAINAAGIYQDQGRWKKSFELFQKAETLARELGHRSLLANALNNLGNLYLYFGRQGEAEAALEESLRIARAEGIKPLIANNLYLLTVAEEAKGNWERVETCLQLAQRDAEALGEAQPILQATLAEGYFHLGRKDFAACEALLPKIRRMAEDSKSPPFFLAANWLEARLRIAQGKFSDFPILDWLQAAEDDARSRGLAMNRWQVLADRGDFFGSQGRPAEAKKAYQDALQIIQELAGEIPESFQNRFSATEKKERIRKALESLPASAEATAGTPAEAGNLPSAFAKVTADKELTMTIQNPTPKPKPPAPGAIDFQKWASLNRRLLLRQDVDALLEEILDASIELTDAERGFVILNDRQALDVRAARNFEKEDLNAEEERISQSIAREVMKAGKTTVIFDAQTEERFAEARSVHALNLRSVLCVPLFSGPRAVGLIYLDNRYRQGIFRPEHLPLVEALADQASLTLEHAKLHQENRERIEELKGSKVIIERLNSRLEEKLKQKTVDLEATRETLKRQNQEISLRYRYDRIVGGSAKLKRVLQTLDRVVDSTANVFIHGESGTGKELIAQAIHFNGPRRDFAFVSENCSAFPENLLESELFGHVKGAFTGADKDKIGLFQLAHQGTLFLDEVGDMPLSMQGKLLRVLQEGEVRQVGGKDYRKVDVRVLAASHRDLKELSAQGKFRQDLYFRLHVLRIDLPPLRDRREDIPLLIQHFLKQAAEKEGGRAPKLTQESLKILMDYPWPGNIRELQNELQRLLVMGTEKITPEYLSPQILQGVEEARGMDLQKGLDRMVSEVEKRAIGEAMERYRGNKVKVAKALKIGRRTLYAKLDLYKIPSDFGKA